MTHSIPPVLSDAVAEAKRAHDDYRMRFPYDTNGAWEVAHATMRRHGFPNVRLPWAAESDGRAA